MPNPQADRSSCKTSLEKKERTEWKIPGKCCRRHLRSATYEVEDVPCSSSSSTKEIREVIKSDSGAACIAGFCKRWRILSSFCCKGSSVGSKAEGGLFEAAGRWKLEKVRAQSEVQPLQDSLMKEGARLHQGTWLHQGAWLHHGTWLHQGAWPLQGAGLQQGAWLLQGAPHDVPPKRDVPREQVACVTPGAACPRGNES